MSGIFCVTKHSLINSEIKVKKSVFISIYRHHNVLLAVTIFVCQVVVCVCVWVCILVCSIFQLLGQEVQPKQHE